VEKDGFRGVNQLKVSLNVIESGGNLGGMVKSDRSAQMKIGKNAQAVKTMLKVRR
jgi:hypothetical protein